MCYALKVKPFRVVKLGKLCVHRGFRGGEFILFERLVLDIQTFVELLVMHFSITNGHLREQNKKRKTEELEPRTRKVYGVFLYSVAFNYKVHSFER